MSTLCNLTIETFKIFVFEKFFCIKNKWQGWMVICMLLTCQASAADRYTGHAICYHIYVIMHVNYPQPAICRKCTTIPWHLDFVCPYTHLGAGKWCKAGVHMSVIRRFMVCTSSVLFALTIHSLFVCHSCSWNQH